ncbi:MAG: NAD(P)/FAD-dependent oxidoreductase [Dehalococcoidia bacterium]|nr:NAD(P)/FAD-dependent oxidoreductase [Dehalococcoidia bacterium]
MHRKWDVIIVGAGPVGSYLASRLAGWGLSTLMLEEHPYIGRPSCCSGIVGASCLSTFPISPRVILREASSATFFSPSGRTLRTAMPHPIAFIVDRPSLDQSMAERAQEMGAVLRLGTGVRGVEVNGEGVTVKVGNSGNDGLHARAVVLSPGFPSSLPEAAGLGQIARWGIGAQAEVPVNGLEETEVYLGQGIAPGFFAWLVPTTPGKALAGVISSQPGPYLQTLLKDLHQRGKIKSQESQICLRRIAFSPRSRTYGARVLAVGEAAGQVKVTTGGGIFYGLICAEEAAQTLKRAIGSGDLSSRSLAVYEKAWKSRLGTELKVGAWARNLYGKLSDQRIDDIFARVQGSDIVSTVTAMDDFSFDWHSPAIVQALKHQALQGLRRLLPFRSTR